MILDFDLSFLKEATTLVDGRLDQLKGQAITHPDPDTYGLYDQIEYITGFGFVACQTYVNAVANFSKCKDKKRWLAVGPKHRKGRTMVELIDAAANYWKHSSEWDLDDLKPRQRQTIDVLEVLDVKIRTDYPLANVLHVMLTPRPARFANLIPFLKQWRDKLPR